MTRNLNRLFKLNLLYISQHIFKSRLPPQASSTLRLYSSAGTVPKKVESVGPVYQKRDHEFKVSRKATVQALEELLSIKTIDALDIAMNNIYFRHISKSILKNNYVLYSEQGVSHDTLLKHPELLTVVDSEMKLKEIQKLPYSIDVVVILILLSEHNFVKFLQSETVKPKDEGKISILSSLLQITPQKACECITNKPFLCTLRASKIKNNIEILTEYGVAPENICSDLWILKYSEDLIRSRLDIAKQHKIDAMKTWMVRAPEKAFQIHLQRRSDNKSILGDNSLVEYLSERLECSVAFANYLILKQPSLKNRSLKKLKELIDFLYAAGFKSDHICRVPKILVHSVETVSKRLKHLKEKGIQIDGLSLLTKSQNQYMQYYEVLVKNKNKSKCKT
ncbi:hypothetical protein Zmor_015313 [Zophobas morio]|uniref:Transcription termination factor, mitochondrial n=1 Tax=Zophobas morio TaxID=2755281 RepID=A0AA38IM68_9CUCU|nr:hypothetical protein Zmor_015313 [Zophobas morio]